MIISKSYFVLPEKYMELKVIKHQKLKQRESIVLSDEKMNFLVPIRVDNFFENKRVIYDLSDCCSLKNYFSSFLLSRRLFIKLIRNVIHSWLEIKHLNFDLSSLLYSFDKVFINPKNWKISFIYIVSDPFIGSGDIVMLIQDIISKLMFDASENLTYITDFLELLSLSPSVYDVEQYLNYLEDETIAIASVNMHCLTCGTQLKESDKICPVCGRTVQTQGVKAFNNTKITSESKKAYLSDGVRTVSILSNPFLIGKIKSNSLSINAEYISRTHAQITIKEGNYYLTDLNSHNGTFLGGVRLVPGKLYPLNNGSIISFVNHKYQFILK